MRCVCLITDRFWVRSHLRRRRFLPSFMYHNLALVFLIFFLNFKINLWMVYHSMFSPVRTIPLRLLWPILSFWTLFQDWALGLKPTSSAIERTILVWSRIWYHIFFQLSSWSKSLSIFHGWFCMHLIILQFPFSYSIRDGCVLCCFSVIVYFLV